MRVGKINDFWIAQGLNKKIWGGTSNYILKEGSFAITQKNKLKLREEFASVICAHRERPMKEEKRKKRNGEREMEEKKVRVLVIQDPLVSFSSHSTSIFV